MSLIEKLTTSSVHFDKRLEYWNRLTGETYPGTSVDQREDTFEAEMLRWSLGDLTMIRPQARASVVTRRPIGSNPERLVLHLQHRGRGLHELWGRMAELDRGDFALVSAWSPYRLEVSEHEFLVVELPRASLEERVDDLDDIIARRIPMAICAPSMPPVYHREVVSWRRKTCSRIA